MALAEAGVVAAVLLAPERPLPPDLPPSLLPLVAWDTMATARRLAAGRPLVRLVPDPYLHLEPGAPGSRVVSEHWAALGVPRVVVAEGQRPGGDREAARAQWIAASDLVLEPGPTLVAELVEGLTRLAARPPRMPLPRVALMGPTPPHGGGLGAYNARLIADLSTLAEVTTVAPFGRPDSIAGVRMSYADAFGSIDRPASYDAAIYVLGNSEGHLPTMEAALRWPGWIWLHETRLPAVATTALAHLDDGEFARHLSRWLEGAYPGRAPLDGARSAGRNHLELAEAGVGLAGAVAARSAGVLVNSEAARRSLLLDLAPRAWQPEVVVVPPGFPPVRARRGEREEADLVVSFGVVSSAKRPEVLVDAAARAGWRLAFVGPCPEVLAQFITERSERLGCSDRVTVVGAVDDRAWWDWMERAAVAVQLRGASSGEMSAAVLDALAAGVPVLTNLASAAGYPVAFLEDAGPGEVAAALGTLLGSEHQRSALSAAGHEFAGAHQMDALARTVLDVVTG